ncbi:MAG TPA: hypothetical protein VGG10_12230 [Rhizomicrobium sp.]|jgi:hypothetical protein
MKKCRLLVALISIAASTPGLAAGISWSTRYPGPLQDYLAHPFDTDDVCVWLSAGLTATDMHLLDAPKTVSKRFVVDDGSISMDTTDFMSFAPDGRVLASSGKDATGPVTDFKFDYEPSGRLVGTHANYARTGDKCDAKFDYDSAGRLFKIELQKKGVGAGGIQITYMPDGRPKESIKRDGLGKGIWRLAYGYGRGTVTVERFEADGGHKRSVFHLDASGRPSRIEYTDDEIGHQSGTVFYAYLPGGLQLLRDEATGPKGERCVTSFWVHRNGAVDEKSIRVLGDRTFFCSEPVGGEPISETYFDKHGNEVLSREGHNAEELGRTIVHWKYVTSHAIAYYGNDKYLLTLS